LSVRLSGGAEIACSSLIIAVGVQYQLLDLPDADRLTGAGIYYGAAMTEAVRCRDKEVYVVGGANSAGQAAMYFSRFAKTVHLIVRADTVRKKMSHYLVEELSQQPNIKIRTDSKIVAVYGDAYLASVDIRNLKTGLVSNVPTDNLFLLIGGLPCTECLSGLFVRDENGFLLTGVNLENHPGYHAFWQLNRKPFHLETNVPGVMAIGDVRHGSAKRMAAAIGDGATAISLVHDYIASVRYK
jgi:thioredoxin reductase (NADPH)